MAYELDKANHNAPWVLLIDDDRSLCLMLEAFFGRFGIGLVAALGPEEAAEIVKSRQPALCLIDLNLYNTIDGFIVIKGLRKKFGPGLPLLVVSGSKTTDVISRALESGADDFLVKPLEPEELKLKAGRYLLLERSPVPLPFVKTPPEGIRASLEFDLKVERAHELGLEILCPHFVSPGSPLLLSCPFLMEALGQNEVMSTVSHCAQREDGSYYLSLIFEDLSAEKRAEWRKCLHEHKRG